MTISSKDPFVLIFIPITYIMANSLCKSYIKILISFRTHSSQIFTQSFTGLPRHRTAVSAPTHSYHTITIDLLSSRTLRYATPQQ